MTFSLETRFLIALVRPTVSAALLLVFSTAAATGVWTTDQKVVEIIVASNDSVNVVMTPMDATSGCAQQWAYHIGTGDGNYKDKLAMLLAALSANKTVSVYVDGCVYGYPHVVNVKLKS